MRYVRSLIVCMALAGVHPGFAMSEDARAKPRPSPKKTAPASLRSLYTDTPEFSSAMTGHFSMDVALFDLDRDGYADLLMSNGSDMSQQQLAYFRNRNKDTRSVFLPWPDWISEANEYMAGMAVGDVNQDGWMDVAVAVAFDRTRDISTGSVKVFLNVNGELQPKPAFHTNPDGFMPVDCALTDVDADGDLDLVVPALVEGTGLWGEQGPTSFSPGRVRIYRNQDGALQENPDWTFPQKLGAASVTAADVNLDGWIDLAFGSPQPTVFYGRPAPPGHLTISDKAGWMAATPPVKAELPLYRVDAGSHGTSEQHTTHLPAKEAGLMLAVSPGCATSSDRPCESPFLIYRPDRGSEPVWKSGTAQFPGGIALADLNQDGFLDLAAGQWGTRFPGGPIWLFQGPFTSQTASEPTVERHRPRIWQAFGAANLRCDPGANETLRHQFIVDGPVNVLTLPQRILTEVVEVSQDGSRLDSRLWDWSPESNWVALAKPAADTVITVTYRVPKILDLAGATWNPDHGSDVFFSFLRTCPQ